MFFLKKIMDFYRLRRLVIWEEIVGNPRWFNPQYIHNKALRIKAAEDGGCLTIAGDEYNNYSDCIG